MRRHRPHLIIINCVNDDYHHNDDRHHAKAPSSYISSLFLSQFPFFSLTYFPSYFFSSSSFFLFLIILSLLFLLHRTLRSLKLTSDVNRIDGPFGAAALLFISHRIRVVATLQNHKVSPAMYERERESFIVKNAEGKVKVNGWYTIPNVVKSGVAVVIALSA